MARQSRVPKFERPPSPKERELGAALRKHREAAKLMKSEVATRMRVSDSTVLRWESGERALDLRTVLALSSEYGASAEQKEDLLRLLDEAEEDAKAVRYWERKEVEPKTRNYLALEAAATSIANFELALVPGLIQAEDYAKAVFASAKPTYSDAETNTNVEVRLQRRKKIEEGEGQAFFHAIFDEGVLYREFGGRDAMREQLRALVKYASYPNIKLQIVRFSAPAGPHQDGPLVVLDFADIPAFVYTEGHLGQNFTQNKIDVNRCRQSFSVLSSLAADPDESLDLIVKRLEDIEES
jgi:transcriptional regulator with XRE-family HTH domain